MQTQQINPKDQVRWELAYISEKINLQLKNATVMGPGIWGNDIHNLREKRDELLAKLEQM